MADFRKWFYALAVVALLAGLTVPASAQTQAPPFQCVANAGVPPIVRGEGYAELVGDITLNCTGGVPTPAGQVVPPVNFTILLNTNITSKLLAGTFDEALLIVDEPHSAVNPGRDILNCGNTGAPDTGTSGPGVCSIISDGNPVDTYNGTATCVAPGTTGAYGCGHPNVFQGREGTLQNPGQYNAVTFLGVPLDPPGTTTSRTIRFTNIRADAKFLGVSSTFTTNYIQAQISVNGNTSLSINNPQQIVAYVQLGLVSSIEKSNFTFLQCVSENAKAFADGVGTNLSNASGTPAYRFTEGFASSFKAKNISYITDEAPGNGVLQAAASYWSYDSTNNPTNHPPDYNQNVPGAIYNTESGFEYPGTNDPTPNPPFGVGTVPVTSVNLAFANGYGHNTGIAGAGVANQGTRLAAQLTNIPQGSTVLVPEVVYLYNDAGFKTGVMVLTSTDSNGAGAYSPYATAPTPANFVQVQSSGLIVYEVLFADPFSIEHADVPMVVAYASNLAQNLPSPGITAQVAGSFAPFYSTASAHNPSSILPVPRFAPNLVPVNLYSISKCACDLLFPYVASAAGYDSGIAIANTSLDPGASVLGFGANPQSGAVEFWYYGEGPNGGAPPNPQCTNTASPGTCPGTTVVPAGQVLTYVLSSGSQTWGLDNRAAGFVGYIIAQAQFQYCHAFAYISALGAGPLTPGTSEGYLGLILDTHQLTSRTNQAAEILDH